MLFEEQDDIASCHGKTQVIQLERAKECENIKIGWTCNCVHKKATTIAGTVDMRNVISHCIPVLRFRWNIVES